jgi:hypothetical protein
LIVSRRLVKIVTYYQALDYRIKAIGEVLGGKATQYQIVVLAYNIFTPMYQSHAGCFSEVERKLNKRANGESEEYK